MKYDLLRESYRQLWTVVQHHPVEMLLACYGCVLWQFPALSTDTSLLFWPTILLLSHAIGQSRCWRVLYWATLLLVPLTWGSWLESWIYTTAHQLSCWVVLPLAVLLARGTTSNSNFVDEAIGYTKALLCSLVVLVVVAATVASIGWALEIIFDIDCLYKIMDEVGRWSSLLLVGGYLLFLGRTLKETPQPGRLFTLLSNYILTPALLIYTGILYAFLLRAITRWEQPDVDICTLVFGYGVAVMVLHALQRYVVRTFALYNKFYQHGCSVIFPLIVLFWVAFGMDVAIREVSLLHDYTLMYGVVLTTGYAYFRWRRNYYGVTVLACLLFAVFCYVPFLRVERPFTDCIYLTAPTEEVEETVCDDEDTDVATNPTAEDVSAKPSTPE